LLWAILSLCSPADRNRNNGLPIFKVNCENQQGCIPEVNSEPRVKKNPCRPSLWTQSPDEGYQDIILILN
jgi:hypothetical protein